MTPYGIANDDRSPDQGVGRRFVLGALLSCSASMLSGCSLFASSKIRYRMTVEVDTPWGLRTGSSVIESIIRDGPRTGQASGIQYEVHGTAVMVDLPDGPLFALLSGGSDDWDYHAHLFHKALAHGSAVPPLSRQYAPSEWRAERAEARKVKPTIILTVADYPALARFRDENDPITAQILDYQKQNSLFNKIFKIRKIFISVTDDIISSKLDKNPFKTISEKYKKCLSSPTCNGNIKIIPQDLVR